MAVMSETITDLMSLMGDNEGAAKWAVNDLINCLRKGMSLGDASETCIAKAKSASYRYAITAAVGYASRKEAGEYNAVAPSLKKPYTPSYSPSRRSYGVRSSKPDDCSDCRHFDACAKLGEGCFYTRGTRY
jgi:hypothetical protein